MARLCAAVSCHFSSSVWFWGKICSNSGQKWAQLQLSGPDSHSLGNRFPTSRRFGPLSSRFELMAVHLFIFPELFRIFIVSDGFGMFLSISDGVSLWVVCFFVAHVGPFSWRVSHTHCCAPKKDLGHRQACLEGSKPNVGESMRGANACVFQFRFELLLYTHVVMCKVRCLFGV